MIIKAYPTPVVRPGVSFVSQTALLANTAVTILAAGSNPAGGVLWAAELYGQFGAGSYLVIIAKTGAAPANVTDGRVVLSHFASNAVANINRLALPIALLPNEGLYVISTLASTTHHTAAHYSVN